MAKKSVKKKSPVKSKVDLKKKKQAGAPKKVATKITKTPVKKTASATQPTKAVKTVKITPAPVVPTRAPLRKIVGADRTVTIIQSEAIQSEARSEPIVADLPEVTSQVAPLRLVQEPVAVLVPPTPAVAPSKPKEKVAWNALSSKYPTRICFMIEMALKESEAAQKWPFPFAKFIACLPSELSGEALAILIMSHDASVEEIASELMSNLDEVEGDLERAKLDIQDIFAAHCPEIERKWRNQMTSLTIGIESLVEHHLVSRVDRNLQILLGTIVLRAMGSQSPLRVQSTQSKVGSKRPQPIAAR